MLNSINNISANIPKYCDDCVYLSPKENIQKQGEQHICKAWNIRLLHKFEHPKIPMPVIGCYEYKKEVE